MKIKMSSNLFFVLQPDMYGLFEPLMRYLEERETEWHYDDENRYGKYLIDEDQQPLFGRDDHPDQFIDLSQLRVRNPEWQEGHYECDSYKMCEIISRAWCDAFNDRLKDRGIKAKIKYTAIDRPKEYNFMTDAAVFEMRISAKEIGRLFDMCRERSDFDAFLHEGYSSYSGFISWMADNLDEWNENAQQYRNKNDYTKEWERSVWQALNFLMWDDIPNESDHNKTDRDEWSEDLNWHIEDSMVGNGAFNDCLEFVPHLYCNDKDCGREGNCHNCYQSSGCNKVPSNKSKAYCEGVTV